MQSTLIDDYSKIVQHQVSGNAFGFSNRFKLAVCGGNQSSCLIDIDEPNKLYKENLKLDPPYRYHVTSYEWDPFNSTRYIQNRNKIIELIDIEKIEVLNDVNKLGIFNGHSSVINETKWSPIKRNLFASCGNDSYFYLWNSESDKPIFKENSFGGAHCLSWSKLQENIFAVTSNNDVKIYDIRKLNSIMRYIPNAHSKRISSIDWCTIEDKFILCGRDKTIRIWSLNSIEDKNNTVKFDDFQCWKAKFMPQSQNFVTIPTCLSTTFISKNLNSSFNKQLSPALNNPLTTKTTLLNQQNENPVNFRVAICQFNTLNQPKIYKYCSRTVDMITDFDFYFNDEDNSLIAWTKDQNLINFSLDPQNIPTIKEIGTKIGDDATDIAVKINTLTSQQSSTNINLLQHQSITSASSRKSSFSEFGNYGTPPTLHIGIQALQSAINATLISDEATLLSSQVEWIKQHQALNFNVQSKSNTRIPEIVPYPKCFCAKFSGLPEHLLVFQNKNLNQYKTYPKQYIPQNDKLTERIRNKNKNILKPSKSRVKLNDKKGRVYIIDMSELISIRYDLAVKYTILPPDNKSYIEKNYPFNEPRGDIPKVWELLQFITAAHSENVSLNPDHGRPWSCSTFGRPLINYIIESCMKTYDIQTIVMVIAKLLQYDKSLIPIPSTVHRQRHYEVCEYEASEKAYSSTHISLNDNSAFPYLSACHDDDKSCDSSLTVHHKNIGLLDPDRTSEYDFLIKYYCDILYRWRLYIKRAELYEYIHDKPTEFDAKFEFPNHCKKCKNKTANAKCYNAGCKTYNLYCSLCQLPVNGLSITCIMCGHGGHYEHIVEWFKSKKTVQQHVVADVLIIFKVLINLKQIFYFVLEAITTLSLRIMIGPVIEQ